MLLGLGEADIAPTEDALKAVEPLRIPPGITLMITIIDEILAIWSRTKGIVVRVWRPFGCAAVQIVRRGLLLLDYFLEVGELILQRFKLTLEPCITFQFGVYKLIGKLRQILDDLCI